MNTSISVLSTVQALGADLKISNGFAYVTGLAPMLVKGIRPTSVVAPVTEVLQVTTGTPTAVASTEYQIALQYTNIKTGLLETKIYTLADSGAGATATTICNYFRSAINGDSEVVPVVASGTSTLILTAVSGDNSAQAVFNVTNIGAGTISFSTGTAGVVGVGKGNVLKNGDFYNSSLVDSSYYYQVIMDFANQGETGSSMKINPLYNRNVLYVLSTATNVESLVGTYGTLTMMLAGFNATWVAGAGTLATTTSTGAIALAGGSTFTADDIRVGDVLFQTTAAYFPVSVITSQTAGFSSNITAGSLSAAAFTVIRLRRF